MTTDKPARLAGELDRLGREVRSLSRASQMSRRSIEGGGVEVYDTDGTLRGVIGIQPDGTNAVVTVNDPIPPSPSAAIVFPEPGALGITWDGTFAADAPKPKDFRSVNIHAAPGAGAFSPTSSTLRASLISPGTFSVALPEDPYTVILVTETTGGSTSPGSEPSTETPAPSAGGGADQTARDLAAQAISLVDGKSRLVTSATAPNATADDAGVLYWIDTSAGRQLKLWDGTDWQPQLFGNDAIEPGALVASDVLAEGTVSAALLDADAINGKTITGAKIRTGDSGQRIQIDSLNGLGAYDAGEKLVTHIDPHTGILTAAGANLTGTLDTSGADTVGGIKVYQAAGQYTQYGVVEFRDGIAGDTPSSITAQANLTPQGSSYSEQGGGLSVKAGKWSGRQGPALALNVETAPAGGYRAVTRLTSPGGVYVNDQPWAQPRVWWLPRTGNPSDPFGAGVYADIHDATITGAPAGDYVITCDLHLSGSVAAQAFVKLVIANNSAAPVLEKRADVSPTIDTKTLTYGLTDFAGGDLRIAGWAYVAAGTGTVTSAGTAITVSYVGPRR